ncbi:MAG: excinuclease ABC subunit UvrB [Candidatus Omnitrophica bacterium]|nr:excinuclease ABC subunit UvrB [Candidatus Omnitrophota bacterium]
MTKFKLISDFKPCGDQPEAIRLLTERLKRQERYSTLLGVTGSGKTFTMASVIANLGKPTLVISHNKTLAAQLYTEFKTFFPENAVEYFVSYYDYYQPEAYIPQTDTYIEKDSSINDDLDRLRLSATSSLMSRGDVIIVASVSCIYNLGSPEDYASLLLFLEAGARKTREEIMYGLINIQYERNDIDFQRGKFRVRGDVIEIFPAYKKEALRVELSEGVIERLSIVDPLTGAAIQKIEKTAIYPAKHFVMGKDRIERALVTIDAELKERVEELKSQNKLLEAQRLFQRTRFDMEMLKEIGYCHGVENYSRHLSERAPGSRPFCLLDYFPDDFLTIIDESHAAIPQIRGMYEGDRARKEVLVDYGFRLPSCLDNRPLRLDEFEALVKSSVFTSATPGPYEIQRSDIVIEQIIRPTGLVDPEIIVKPSAGQIDDLIEQIRKRSERKERVLVTTLTKKMAEDLSRYLNEMGLNVKYLHSEIQTIERVEILRDLRLRKFDAVVGINLLREGLDLPEVSLVAILDADKEGFLRSQTSLIQVAGRAARNINGQVIMYADVMTGSMKKAISESRRRRELQLEYNKKNNITPKSIQKAIVDGLEAARSAEEIVIEAAGETPEEHDVNIVIAELEYEMELAARNLQFEKAAELRDKIRELKKA